MIGVQPGLRSAAELALALCLLAVAASCNREETDPDRLQLNLLIVVPDTLRADHVGSYGYPRPTTPHLDAFSSHSFVFENAQSTAPWTAPSLISLMTSLYPDVHQVRGYPNPRRLSDKVTTLAETLRRHGYATAAFTEGGYAKGDFGLDRGFDTYPQNPGDDQSNVANQVFPSRLEGNLDRALGWLRANGQMPFFMFFHTYEPHFPFRAPSEFIRQFRPAYDEEAEHDRIRRAIEDWNRDRKIATGDVLLIKKHRKHCRLAGQPKINDPKELEAGVRGWVHSESYQEWLRDLYDAEVAYMDQQLDRLWTELERMSLLQRTVIVVVSDHGEGLGDHGAEHHGGGLFEEILRVVLMIRVPGDDHRAGRVTELVRTVDVMPTILELLGIAEESLDLQGRSLVPLMAGESFAMHAFSHARTNNQGLDPQYTVRDAQWRLTVDVSSGRHWLYDLETDPRETTNVADQHRGVVAELETVLMGQIAIDRALKERLSSDPETHELDEELRRELRSLGYLDGEDPSR